MSTNKTTVSGYGLGVWLMLLVMALGCAVDPSAPQTERRPVTYYVDAVNGADDNTGIRYDSPWQTLSKMQDVRLYPGDTIRFKRGSTFTGPFFVRDSGKSGNPIVLTDYGDVSEPAPAFTNAVFDPSLGNFGNCIRLKGSYVVVENLYFHDTVADLPEDAGGFTTMWE